MRKVLRVPPRPLSVDEPLSRFLLSRDDYSPKHMKARPRAFVPFPHRELSVLRTLGMSEEEVWDWGQLHVGDVAGKQVKGRAETAPATYEDQGLTVTPDDIPPGHANVLGWPAEKSQQMLIAQKLAAIATLVLAPSE